MTYSDNLTARQEQILRLLVDAWDDGGTLTYSEVGRRMRITDRAIADHLQALESKGWLRLDAYRYGINECALERYSARWLRKRDFATIAESATPLA